jgi:hypothetical protein
MAGNTAAAAVAAVAAVEEGSQWLGGRVNVFDGTA